MRLESSRQIFDKSTNIKFNQQPSTGSRIVPCVRTDMKKLMAVFRNFAKAPKINGAKHIQYGMEAYREPSNMMSPCLQHPTGLQLQKECQWHLKRHSCFTVTRISSHASQNNPSKSWDRFMSPVFHHMHHKTIQVNHEIVSCHPYFITCITKQSK